jgi:hypothetical protein
MDQTKSNQESMPGGITLSADGYILLLQVGLSEEAESRLRKIQQMYGIADKAADSIIMECDSKIRAAFKEAARKLSN